MRHGADTTHLTLPAVQTVDVVSMLGAEVLATSVPVIDGEATFDAKRDSAGALDITVPPGYKPVSERSPLAAWGQTLTVTVNTRIGDATYSTLLGRFRIQSWEENDDGSVRVRGQDLMQDLADSPAAYPSSPPKGGWLHNEVRRLAAPLPVRFHIPDTRLGELSWGVNRVENLRQLAQGAGARMRIEADDYLHFYPARTGADVAATYTATDILLKRATSGARDQYTSVTAWGRAADAKPDSTPMVATVHATDLRLQASQYGERRKIVQVDAATSYPQLLEHAQNIMRTQTSEATQVSVEIVADPRLELYDVIAVEHGGTIIVGEVHAIALPLDGGRMRVDIVEVRF